MKKSKLLSLGALFAFALVLIASPTTSAVSSTTFPDEYDGYFTGDRMYDAGDNGFVIKDSLTNDSTADGIPAYIDSVNEFINFIDALFYKDKTIKVGSTTYTTKNRDNNQLGAYFIIQTMRASSSTTFDRTKPNASDLADWKTTVRNYVASGGTITWKMTAGEAGVTSKTPNTYTGVNGGVSDVSWYPHAGSTSLRGLIVFKRGSTIDYMIKRNCGNPMGAIKNGLSVVNWSITPATRINSSYNNNTPGTVVGFEHRLTNNGPTVTSKSIDYNTRIVRVNSSTRPTLAQVLDAYNGIGGTLLKSKDDYANIASGEAKGVMKDWFSNSITRYAIVPGDVGSWICGYITARPDTESTNEWVRGYQCKSIPSDYDLTPSTSGSASHAGTGSTVAVTSEVTNAGMVSPDAEWKLVTFTATPAEASDIPTALATGTGTPEAYYGFGATEIDSDNQAFPEDSTIVDASNRTMPNEPVGTRICWALSVRPYSMSGGASRWRYGIPYCVVISKKPVVQILGNDLIVGRNNGNPADVITNIKNTGTRRYGSWTEYGALVSGSVTGLASARGYAGGSNVTTLCAASLLSFANRPDDVNDCGDSDVGNYSFKPAAQSIASRFPASSAIQIAGDQSLDGFISRGAGKVYTNTSAGTTIDLTADSDDTVPAGMWFVINAPNATVRIMDNIIYTGDTLRALTDIPQVIIIAKNIIIADTVAQVDAWLVATGTGADGRVNTCGANTGTSGVTQSSRITSEVCDIQLKVNGPVIANHLLLRRTAGAGSTTHSGDPAEVFNLRPDAYLWATSLHLGTYKATTVMTTELPPRY